MTDNWMTGEQVENEFKVVPIEIGKACFDGTITAYVQTGWGPIYEISKLDRVPKYPPPGVDRMDHIQRGDPVKWDWEEILGVREKRSKLLACEQELKDVIAVWKAKTPPKRASAVLQEDSSLKYLCPVDISSTPPYEEDTPAGVQIRTTDGQLGVLRLGGTLPNLYKESTFQQLDALIPTLSREYRELENSILEMTEPPIEAMTEAKKVVDKNGVLCSDIYNSVRSIAWQALMPARYYWVIDGELLENDDLEGRLFFFDFDMLKQRVKNHSKASGQLISIKDIGVTYTQQIRVMFFERSEVVAAQNAQRFGPMKVGSEIQESAPVQEFTIECCTTKEQNQFTEILIEKEARIVELEKQVETQGPIGGDATPATALIPVNVPTRCGRGKQLQQRIQPWLITASLQPRLPLL